MNFKLRYLVFCLLFLLPPVSTAAGVKELFSDTEGQAVKLLTPRKWLIINYWASWCGPCHAEIPAINDFYQKHKDNNDVMILGVNYDLLEPEVLRDLVKKMKIKFPVLTTDPAAILGLEAAPVLPATYVFSPEGKLVKKLYGVQTQQKLEDAITS